MAFRKWENDPEYGDLLPRRWPRNILEYKQRAIDGLHRKEPRHDQYLRSGYSTRLRRNDRQSVRIIDRILPVALTYALEAGTSVPSSVNPGYVYEIEINDSHGVELIDPVKAIANGAPDPLNPSPYQHNGYPSALIGIITSLLAPLLLDPLPVPPTSTVTAPTLHVSGHMRGIAAALRDAEVLAVRIVPTACVVNRWAVS